MKALLWRHLRPREFRFLGFVLANLIAIGLFLASGQEETAPVGGWRRIDTEALARRLQSGELQMREALWSKPVEAGRERPR